MVMVGMVSQLYNAVTKMNQAGHGFIEVYHGGTDKKLSIHPGVDVKTTRDGEAITFKFEEGRFTTIRIDTISSIDYYLNL